MPFCESLPIIGFKILFDNVLDNRFGLLAVHRFSFIIVVFVPKHHGIRRRVILRRKGQWNIHNLFLTEIAHLSNNQILQISFELVLLLNCMNSAKRETLESIVFFSPKPIVQLQSAKNIFVQSGQHIVLCIV